MTNQAMLEKAILDGRVHLRFESNMALLHDYKHFKHNKVIVQAVLAEMRRRGGFRIIEEIDFLRGELKRIREEVKEYPARYSELWSEYREAQKRLEDLDPYDEQIDIGILGKPFGAGFADQI